MTSSDNDFIKLKLGDIVELSSSSNPDVNNTMYIISYIDSEKLILNSPNLEEPLLLTLDDEGKFSNMVIEAIYLLNRSDQDGYLAQNNLNISDLLELVFIEESGAVEKVYGQITAIEQDMMEFTLHPSKEPIYIDFAYKGVPLELNLRAINVIDEFPKFDDEGDVPKPVTPVSEISVPKTPATDEPEQPEMSPIAPEMPPPEERGQPSLISESEEQLTQLKDTIQEQARQLFISADQLFMGDDLGEFQQEVRLGEKERRYGLDTQLNDLLDEMLSVIPNDERNSRVMGNITNMLHKFKQLREKHSEFDDFENANKKPLDPLKSTPLIKAMTDFETSLSWILPVISVKKQLYDISLEESMLQDVDPSSSLRVLKNLETFNDNYYKQGSSSDNQEKYESYLRFMRNYFKSLSELDGNATGSVINTMQLKQSMNAIIDTLGDFYSEVAKSVGKDQINLTRKRFVSNKLLGDLHRTTMVKSKMGDISINMNSVSNGDTLQLKSFMVLPKQITQHNHVNVNTLILDKTENDVGLEFFNYLRKSTSVVTHYVSPNPTASSDADLKTIVANHVVNPFKFRDNVLSIEPSQSFLDAFNALPNDEKQNFYLDFLSQFLPSNQEILRELKNTKTKTIKNLTSLHQLIQHVSEFLIDKDNLNDDDLREAKDIVDRNIARIKRKLIKHSDELNAIIEKEKSKVSGGSGDEAQSTIAQPTLSLLLSNVPLMPEPQNEEESISIVILNIIRNSLTSYYELAKNTTTSEMLEKINKYDNGKFLNLSLTYLSLNLHSSLDLNQELAALDEVVQANIEQEQATNTCKTITLAKKYTSLDSLNQDNNSITYFDKPYDVTRYDIIELYVQQQNSMPPPEFKEFLKNKLMENVGLSESDAEKETDAMIAGKRVVDDGNFAVLEIPNEPPRYYVRENNAWKRNTNVKYDVQTNELVCETQEECYKIKDNCATKELSEQLINATNIQSMINIFDIKREKTHKQMKTLLENSLQFLYNNKANKDFVNAEKRKKSLKKQHAIANANKYAEGQATPLQSPYAKLFQAILGQQDFAQKQHNIVKFVNQFTFDKDDTYWFLCVKTSKKLVPKFMYTLARTFIAGEDYFTMREQICATQGMLSDDGDAWVDKYSGYVIKQVDASAEEGFDQQGYKLQVREKMESMMDEIIKERQNEILGQSGDATQEQLQFTDADFKAPYADIVVKIVNALSRSIMIDLHSHKPFIVNNVLRFNSANFTSKEDYDKKAKLVKKQKNITLPPFEDALNLNILLLTLCMSLVAIQIAKPTLNSKKSVAGCFKYFRGFPLEENGNNDAVVYIACVANKIKNPKVYPWKALGKTRVEGLVSKMMAKLEKQIMKDTQVLEDINEKREWMVLHQEEEVEPERAIDKNATLPMWHTFKPSLDVNYNVSDVAPPTTDFKETLLDHLKKGSRKQHDSVNALIGKIREYSDFYKNQVHNIVEDEDFILMSVYREPYMQNCFGSTLLREKNTNAYLEGKNQLLGTLIANIAINEKIISDIKKIVKSPTINPFFNSRKPINDGMGDFSEETVYKYFIKQCQFGNDVPIDAATSRLCGAKPAGFNANQPFEEQLNFLKSNGHQYSVDSLIELLKLKGQQHMIPSDMFIQYYDNGMFVFRNFSQHLELLSGTLPLNRKLFDEPVVEGIGYMLSNAKMSPDGYIDENNQKKYNSQGGIVREVKNKMADHIEQMKIAINEFINSQSVLSRKQSKGIADALTTMDSVVMKNPNNNTYHNVKQILYMLCVVFPNMVINNADFSYYVTPKHWGLSELHDNDVKKIVVNFYKGLSQFYTSVGGGDGDEALSDVEAFKSNTLFKKTLMLCKKPLRDLYDLVMALPLRSASLSHQNGHVFLLDERFYSLFFNYAYHKVVDVFIKCAKLINERSSILQEYEKKRRLVVNDAKYNADDLWDKMVEASKVPETITVEELYDFMNQQLSDEETLFNGDVSLYETLAYYLSETLPLMNGYFTTATQDYTTIHKKVMASRENEKNTITRSLKEMSDEEREIQNLFKGHKLESWGKGLTKGLTRYVKENYDEEREAIEKRLQYERSMGEIDVATRMNMDVFMDNAEYEAMVAQEIEAEELSMAHLGDDDDYGDDRDGDEYY